MRRIPLYCPTFLLVYLVLSGFLSVRMQGKESSVLLRGNFSGYSGKSIRIHSISRELFGQNTTLAVAPLLPDGRMEATLEVTEETLGIIEIQRSVYLHLWLKPGDTLDFAVVVQEDYLNPFTVEFRNSPLSAGINLMRANQRRFFIQNDLFSSGKSSQEAVAYLDALIDAQRSLTKGLDLLPMERAYLDKWTQHLFRMIHVLYARQTGIAQDSLLMQFLDDIDIQDPQWTAFAGTLPMLRLKRDFSRQAGSAPDDEPTAFAQYIATQFSSPTLSAYYQGLWLLERAEIVPEQAEEEQQMAFFSTALEALQKSGRLSETQHSFLTEQLRGLQQLRPGNLAPAFEGFTLEGKQLRLSDFRGRMVIADVWATWCVPCLQEKPFLLQVAKKFPQVQFVLISTDREKDFPTWEAMVRKDVLPVNVTHILLRENRSDFSSAYQVSSIPRFFAVDAKGLLLDGYAPRPSTGGLEAAILKWLSP